MEIDPQRGYPQQKVAILREHLGEPFGLVSELGCPCPSPKYDNFATVSGFALTGYNAALSNLRPFAPEALN